MNSKIVEKAGMIGTTYALTTLEASKRLSSAASKSFAMSAKQKAALTDVAPPKGSGDLSALRTQAMKELKRENVGVQRTLDNQFVVGPEAIAAFVQAYQAARPEIEYFEPKVTPTMSFAQREKAFLAADQDRIKRENEALDRHEADVRKKLALRNKTIRLIQGMGKGPVVERVAETTQAPKIERPTGLTQISLF